MALGMAIAALVGCGSGDINTVIANSKAKLAKGEAKTAAIELKAALQDSPESAEARRLLGEALFASGDAPSALIELRKALDFGYPKAVIAPLLGRVLLALGQNKNLVDELSSVSIDEPAARADLESSLAMAYMILGDKTNSDKRLASALGAKPDWPAAIGVQARAMLRDKNVAGAVKVLEAAVARDPKDAESRMLLGDINAFARRDLNAAAEQYVAAVAAKPDLVRGHVSLINVYWSLDKRTEARTQLEKLRELQPNNFRTKFIEAQFAAVDKDFVKARELGNALLAVAPDYVELLYLVGTSESALGNQRQAVAHFARALFVAPSRSDIRSALGETYLRSGQYDRAFEAVRGLVESSNADARALNVAAQAQLGAGRSAESRDLFQRASKLQPADIGIQASLANLDFATGDTERALLRLKDISINDKGGLADQALVALQLKQRDYDAAIQSIERLATKAVDPTLPPMLRGHLEQLRGDRAAARKQFEEVLAKRPAHPGAVKLLADLDIQDGKSASAIERYERLLQASPNNADALAEVARLRSRAGAPKAVVVDSLNLAIKAEPLDSRYRLMLVDYLSAVNDQKGAVLAAQDAAAVMPNSEPVLVALGRAQLKAGEVQQAFGTYRRIVQANPRAPEGYIRMAEAQVVAKDPNSAIATLRQALTVAPESELVQRRLAELLMKSKKPDEALAVARAAQRQSPKAPAGYLLEAELQAQAKRPDAEISVLQVGLKASGTPDVALMLYRRLNRAGRVQDFNRLAEDWMRQRPKDKEFLRAIADVDMQAHRYPAAERRYEALVTIDTQDAPALNNLAWLRMKLGKPGALALVERALTLSRDNPTYLDTQAHIFAAQKQFAQASKVSRRAIEIRPEDKLLRLSSAEVIALSGDSKALEAVLAPLDRDDDSFVRGELQRVRALVRR